MDLLRYYHTLKFLKPVQFYGRLRFRLLKPKPDLRPAPPLRERAGVWAAPARRRPSLIGPTRCRFLNEEHEIASPEAWNAPSLEKLWLYNLHYFDFLNDGHADSSTAWGRALIGRWVAENPPGKGVGWEPYPTSLRIVNWTKWALAGNRLEQEWLHSLAAQTRWLAGKLETHLLGNHLFANAKALAFAGVFFEGDEAEKWFNQAMSLLAGEIPEQILPDGGHFELSPMYHSLALEDLLDLFNLLAAFPNAARPRWATLIEPWPAIIDRMRAWLSGLCHPDGEIAFFNDAATGISPSPSELESYFERLGFSDRAPPASDRGWKHFADSGYVRVWRDGMVALVDVAAVGPDYLPGHAHADTLSFEASLHGRRVLVNSGTSRYGLGAERTRQRGTAAHNTVAVDGEDSSEVWGGFRVARRARPFGLRIEEASGELRIVCAHDGYLRLPGKPVHRREWRFADRAIEIVDAVDGQFGEAIGRLFFHPDVKPFVDAACAAGHVELPEGRIMRWTVEGARTRLTASTYHPEFGVALPNHCLEMQFVSPRCVTRLTWN